MTDNQLPKQDFSVTLYIEHDPAVDSGRRIRIFGEFGRREPYWI